MTLPSASSIGDYTFSMKRTNFSQSVITVTKKEKQLRYARLKRLALTKEELEAKIATLKSEFKYYDSKAAECANTYHRLTSEKEKVQDRAREKREKIYQAMRDAIRDAKCIGPHGDGHAIMRFR